MNWLSLRRIISSLSHNYQVDIKVLTLRRGYVVLSVDEKLYCVRGSSTKQMVAAIRHLVRSSKMFITEQNVLASVNELNTVGVQAPTTAKKYSDTLKEVKQLGHEASKCLEEARKINNSIKEGRIAMEAKRNSAKREFLFNENGSLVVINNGRTEVLIPNPYSLVMFAEDSTDIFKEWNKLPISLVCAQSRSVASRIKKANPSAEAFETGFMAAVKEGLLKEEDAWKFGVTVPEKIVEKPLPPKPEAPPIVCEQTTVGEQPPTQPQGEEKVETKTFWSSVRANTITPINTHVIQPVWAGTYGIKAGYTKVAGWTKSAWGWITASTWKRETSCAVAGALCVAAAVVTPLTIAYSVPFIAVPYTVRGAVYSYTPTKNFIIRTYKKAAYKLSYLTSPTNNGFSCFNEFAFSCCE